MCVLVCVSLSSCMWIVQQQINGLFPPSFFPPPPLGIVVCEGVMLGVVGCGAVWGGGGIGLGGVAVWFSGMWVKEPP